MTETPNDRRAADVAEKETDTEFLHRTGWQHCWIAGDWHDPQQPGWTRNTAGALMVQRRRDAEQRRQEGAVDET